MLAFHFFSRAMGEFGALRYVSLRGFPLLKEGRHYRRGARSSLADFRFASQTAAHYGKIICFFFGGGVSSPLSSPPVSCRCIRRAAARTESKTHLRRPSLLGWRIERALSFRFALFSEKYWRLVMQEVLR